MPSHRTAVKDTSLLRAIDQGTPLSGIEEEEHQRDAPADSQSSEDIDISQMIESMMKSVCIANHL